MSALHVSDRRKFGRQDWTTTLVGFGSVAIGNMGKVVLTPDARALVDHAWDHGVRLFDTAPMYGHGLADYRLAAQLMDRPREDFTLVTKVGRTLTPAKRGSFDAGPWRNTPPLRLDYDYSYDGVMRQVEQSLQRMGNDQFDVLLVHDIDHWTHGAEQPIRFKEAVEGAFEALLTLRDQGQVAAIGIGVNDVDVCLDAIEAVDIDCVLIAGRYSLLDATAGEELLPICARRGIAVINARVFGSGILATGTSPGARFDYAPAPDDVLSTVRIIEAICRRHDVPLGAVALQFAAAHPAVVNVCLGVSSVPQQEQNFRWLEVDVPPDIWQELATLGIVRGVND